GAALLAQVSPAAWQHSNLWSRYECTKAPEVIRIAAIIQALAQAPVPHALALSWPKYTFLGGWAKTPSTHQSHRHTGNAHRDAGRSPTVEHFASGPHCCRILCHGYGNCEDARHSSQTGSAEAHAGLRESYHSGQAPGAR